MFDRDWAPACGRIAELRISGRYREAAAYGRDVLSDAEQAFGPNSAELMPVLNQIGILGKYSGDFVMAEDAYRRALRIVQAGEAAGTEVASAVLLHNLAGLAHARGDVAEAERLARAGIRSRTEGSSQLDPSALAADRAALAAILIDAGNGTEAAEILLRTIQDSEASFGPDHYEVGIARHNLGSLYLRSGRLDDAMQELESALRIKELACGMTHPELAITLHNLAKAYLASRRRDDGRACLKRAVQVLDGVVTADHPTLVACRTALFTSPKKTGEGSSTRGLADG
ncbi:hypothetical protein GCM10022235_85770 [Kribbella ginsengisoli]|uniref:Tetratricopeptide repeat protein n=2 Tax=Kribbella ginsengisoli TaxID=363865 RepID=A0ABP6ZAC6_9ACTN